MKPPSILPDVPEAHVPIRVYFFDTDAGGVVHNVAYLRMIEVARSQFAEQLGWSLGDMLVPEGGCPVVVRTEIDYIKPAKLGDDLDFHVELAELHKVRFLIRFTVARASDGVILCRAQQTMATVNLQTGRPLPLRRDWIEKWSHLCKNRE